MVKKEIENMRKIVNPFIETSKKCLKDLGNCISMFFIQTKDGIMVVPFQFTNQEEKVLMLNIIKEMLERLDSDFYIFVGEAWYVKTKKTEEISVPPSQSKKRKECLQIIYQQRDKTSYGVIIPFERKGKTIKFGRKVEFSNLTEKSFFGKLLLFGD